jgi:magnesium-transporting ATPase (P-type)
MNLFEQFHRLVNIFFLFLAIIQAIPSISPLNQTAGFVQLLFMLSITAVKQAYEDYLRHRADDEVNHRTTRTFPSNAEVEWQSVAVGDILIVDEDCEFPCDCLLLEISGGNRRCRVDTSALDGETNHKFKTPVGIANLKNSAFEIEISAPAADLASFSGHISASGATCPATLNCFVPRGCVLKGIENVIAIACYTGDDTKLVLNSMKPRFKFTELDRIMLRFSVVLLIAMCLVCGGMAVGHYFWSVKKPRGYLRLPENEHYFLDFFSWVIDLQMILPLAVYSSLDIVRFLLSFSVDRDPEMRENNRQSKCRNSDLLSTLGRVTHIFSDKTGTLTKNLLSFRAAAFKSAVFETKDAVLANLDNSDVYRFLIAVCVCNSAVVFDRTGQTPTWETVRERPMTISYQTASQDELALLEFARDCGFILYASYDDSVQIIVKGEFRTFQKLAAFEFDSHRKRSSVLCQIEGHTVLFVKGADSVMVERSSEFSMELKDRIVQLGKMGLRTLCFGFKEIENPVDLVNEYRSIKNLPVDSIVMLNSLADRVETEFRTFCVTGVEDELQDGIADTLTGIRQANIKVWMLTGDRLDTAVHIALTSGLIQPDQPILSSVDQCDYENSVLAVDVNAILSNRPLFEIARRFSAVICGRCEPIDKGNCIREFLSRFPSNIILAIGDGVNDVDMIRAANVGVGVEGREGTDAVLSSDFSIPSFRFLLPLLVVHGRSYARRTYLLIIITFYKNLLLGFPQFFYGLFNGFSATSAFDSGYFMMYNIVLTIPQHCFGCLVEQDIDPKLALVSPQVYADSQRNGWFDPGEVAWTYFLAMFHPFLVFFFAYFETNQAVLNESGMTLDHAVFTQVIGWNVMFVLTVELIFQFRTCSLLHCVFYVGCIVSNFGIQYFYGMADREFWKILQITFGNLRIWFETPIVIAVCVIINLVKTLLVRKFRPRLSEWLETATGRQWH